MEHSMLPLIPIIFPLACLGSGDAGLGGRPLQTVEVDARRRPYRLDQGPTKLALMLPATSCTDLSDALALVSSSPSAASGS